ncbi:uncharacterized [Tachysurus ichikawai]
MASSSGFDYSSINPVPGEQYFIVHHQSHTYLINQTNSNSILEGSLEEEIVVHSVIRDGVRRGSEVFLSKNTIMVPRAHHDRVSGALTCNMLLFTAAPGCAAPFICLVKILELGFHIQAELISPAVGL